MEKVKTQKQFLNHSLLQTEKSSTNVKEGFQLYGKALQQRIKERLLEEDALADKAEELESQKNISKEVAYFENNLHAQLSEKVN